MAGRERSLQSVFHTSPEQKLWLAVMGAAASDAVSCAILDYTGNPIGEQASSDEAYFLHPTRNFYLVCHYAGLDPEYVKRKMEKAIYEKRKQSYLSPLQR